MERRILKMRIKAKDPKLIALIGDFLKIYLPTVKSRDGDTIDSYRHSLNIYLQFLQYTQGTTLMTIRSNDFCQKNIVAFMSWLHDHRGNVATTINHRLSDIRGFCRYLMKKNVISPVDYEDIREVSDVIDDRNVDFTWLSTKDVKTVLEQVGDNRDSIRDRFLLSILYESGARINEVLSLKHKDLKPAGKAEIDIHFFGKGNKHRITPLSAEIWKQYGNYCKKYHLNIEPEELLFYTCRSGRKHKMSSDNVSRILADCEILARKECPELQHLHSHLFRRSRAMHLYQAGVPLPTVSEWLGHSNIETTRFYAKVTEEMKREALHKLSESDKSVFKDDVAFKYAGDEEMLKRLCGLR
jgi:site-specific recombinase XerD